MKSNTYFLNIGNSYTSIADYNLVSVVKISNDLKLLDKLNDYFDNNKIDEIIVASVNNKILLLIKQSISAKFTILSYKNFEQYLDFSLVHKEVFGIDRILNLFMANLLYPKKNIIVIDFGTCITIECINEEQIIQGGYIMLGREKYKQSLNYHIEQLPNTPVTNHQQLSIGKNTNDAIDYSINYSIIAFLEKVIKLLIRKISKDTLILATGGDKEFFLDKIKDIIDLNDNHTLHGIKEIHSKTNI